MTKKELRASIRAKLDGMDARQAQRNAARAHGNLRQMVYVRRAEGAMDTLQDARKALRDLGVPILSQRRLYGVTILETKVGVRLAFLPDGRLDWRRRHRSVKAALEDHPALCEKPTCDPDSTRLAIPGVTVFPDEASL